MIYLIFLFSLIVTAPSIASESLYEHSSNPLQAESKPETLESWETPVSGFFVRSHFGVPSQDDSEWTLIVDGLVKTPLKLSLTDLQKMSQKSFYAVLECSGNGRGYQTPQAPGVQWKKGAVGNAEWTGALMQEVLARAGVQANAHFARVEGADKPIFPSIPRFIRSIPLEKFSSPDTLIALKMNREPLIRIHGGPLRLILPGWYGENWIKWLTHITLTEKEDSGYFMKKAYRVPKTSVNPSSHWDSSTGLPIHQLPVQSLITYPLDHQTVATRTLQIRGKAFSGAGAITQVELSDNHGKDWKSCDLKPPRPTGGWQEFECSIQINQTHRVTLMSRATDSSGAKQPLAHTWNPGGYIRNAVDSVTLTIPEKGELVLNQRCLICHASELIKSQRLNVVQWEGVVKKMEGFGVQLSPLERKDLLNYLKKFSPDVAPQNPKVI